MRSIKEIFVVGHGPSSSHTIGPSRAAQHILDTYKDIKFVEVTLYGSLALTGKGHLTDYIIHQTFKDTPHEVKFDYKTEQKHPNTMIFKTTLQNGEVHEDKIVSIGGGSIVINDQTNIGKDVYPHHYLTDILSYTKKKGITLDEYVVEFEGPEILDWIDGIIKTMRESAERGIKAEGELPGTLHITRKAHEMYERYQEYSKEAEWKDYNMVIAFCAHAVAEENASGGLIVTAPTCGSAGVIPGVLGYLTIRGTEYEKIRRGMLVAGLIGILCKTNGSISGAEAGCQAEIGVACAMGAALIATAKGYINSKIAQSAEIAIEHSLGLTCDPVDGYVQIPCIERCSMYAMKARSAVSLAKLIPHRYNLISFDDSVKTMKQTGKDMNVGYRETSEKGLASLIKDKREKEK